MGGGGKKHHEIELFEWSRTSRVIATTSIDLQQLLLEGIISLIAMK